MGNITAYIDIQEWKSMGKHGFQWVLKIWRASDRHNFEKSFPKRRIFSFRYLPSKIEGKKLWKEKLFLISLLNFIYFLEKTWHRIRVTNPPWSGPFSHAAISKHPHKTIFLAKPPPPLNLQTVQPPFLGNPPSILVFREPTPLKFRFFCEPSKY